jgi:hypothetical protein
LAKPTEISKDATPSPVKKLIVPGCGDVYSQETFAPSFVLSPNFRLSTVSSGAIVSRHTVSPQHGLSRQDIVCNLKALCEQVLEPIKKQYPSMIVTSGFRSPGHSKAVGISQHEKGQAADIQFSGLPRERYFQIAQWIRDNVPFDQMLLEYKSTGTKLPWIHLTFNREGSRNTFSTFFNHRTAPGGRNALIDLV